MGKPFQFSMRRIFVIAALVCITTSLLKILVAVSRDDGFVIAELLVIGGAVIGALIGCSFDKPVAGAIVGAWSGLAVIAGILLVCMQGGSSHLSP